MEKIVLTGGPGSGKSSILIGLEQLGEVIIRESAEDYIKLQQARGDAQPWLQPDFQEAILKLQLQRETRISTGTKRVFIDRGIADGLAYVRQRSKIYYQILNVVARYSKIFLIENLGNTDTNQVRRENQKQALIIERKLQKIYADLGYEVIRIAPGPVQERIHAILKQTRKIMHDKL